MYGNPIAHPFSIDYGPKSDDKWYFVDFQAGLPLSCKKYKLTGPEEIALMTKISDPDSLRVKVTNYRNARINTIVGCIGENCRVSITAETQEACESMLGHALDFYRELQGKK